MIKIIIIRGIIKIDIGQMAEIEEYHTEVEVSMDKITDVDHVMSIIIEMTLGETILEMYKITEVKIIEVDIEGTIEMTIVEEAEVGLGTDNIQIISE